MRKIDHIKTSLRLLYIVDSDSETTMLLTDEVPFSTYINIHNILTQATSSLAL